MIDLPDPTSLAFRLPSGEVLTVAIPTLSVLADAYQQRPPDGATAEESFDASALRLYRETLILMAGPRPPVWTLGWLVWRRRKARLARTLGGQSVDAIKLMWSNCWALANGAPVDQFHSLNQERSFAGQLERLQDSVTRISRLLSKSPDEVYAMRADQFSHLISQINADAQEAAARRAQS